MNNVNDVNEIAHKIYCEVEPQSLPKKFTGELFDKYAVLALTKGATVTNEDVHQVWCEWATKYDPLNKSLVPFDQLPPRVKAEDSPFTHAIKMVANKLVLRN